MPYLDSLDIANRGLQHVGDEVIAAVDENSKINRQATFAYDKLRRAELRRNVWRFAIRRAVLRAVDFDTMILRPTLYDSTKIYLLGTIVSDENGELWVSITPDNLNNTPGVNNDAWDKYFGPLTVSPYDEDVTYFAGELVYKAGAVAGSYAVYMSLQNNNDDDPSVADAWDATVTYHRGAVVSRSGSQWRSRIELNLNITPANGPAAFDISATYALNDTVTGSDDFIYSSTGNGNTGNDPVTDGGVHWTNTNVANAWSSSPTVATSATSWRVIASTIESLQFMYPIGTGPASQALTKNVYRLPAGFLRQAPQDSKAGSTSYLGAPSGLAYKDWLIEGDYIVTQDLDPIMLRFVADVSKVKEFDDMFCEGLACRIATAICEPITQSGSKLQTIASAYKMFMGEARTVNAIEVGSTEPAIDDYIACRI